jgi:hypothetical protein
VGLGVGRKRRWRWIRRHNEGESVGRRLQWIWDMERIAEMRNDF